MVQTKIIVHPLIISITFQTKKGSTHILQHALFSLYGSGSLNEFCENTDLFILSYGKSAEIWEYDGLTVMDNNGTFCIK